MCRLRLADARPLTQATDVHRETRDASALAPNESFWQLDISNYDDVLAALAGVDVVVHLAADPDGGADFYESVLQRNVVGAYNIFAAAAAQGCSRVVFASTTQVMNGYVRSQPHAAPPETGESLTA